MLRCSFFIVSIRTQACSLSTLSPPHALALHLPIRSKRHEKRPLLYSTGYLFWGESPSAALPRHELAQQLLFGKRKTRGMSLGSHPPNSRLPPAPVPGRLESEEKPGETGTKLAFCNV